MTTKASLADCLWIVALLGSPRPEKFGGSILAAARGSGATESGLCQNWRDWMKTLAVLAAALGAGLLATAAQAAMMSAPVSKATPGIELAGVVCGPGMHLRAGTAICVPNVGMGKVCPVGWHLGAGAVCRRN
jgi:hypothetical protein